MDIGTKLGHYEITGRIGAGGMGQVYRARDSKLDRDVAIKVVPAALATDATLLARFEREAKLLAAVVHPNIATVHGVEAAGERPYLVMELVHGTTLADRLREEPLPLDEAREIISQIAHGLEAAHKQEIVHRDLKPANVAITPDGLVKILDFGIAKALAPETGSGTGGDTEEASPEDPTAALELTEVGAPIGTAPYMSPEQVRGQTVDARSDIWAFGCVAYETLAGRRAFDRETAADTLSAILNEAPDWEALPPEAPASLRSVLARCLEKDARRRLHSIADARIGIEDSIADPGVATGQVPEPVSAPSRGRLRWIVAAFAALAVVALAADIGGLRGTLFAGWGDRTSGSGAGDVAATTLGSVRSLVALPSSLTGAEEQPYLADAIPSRLTAELVRSGAVAMRQPPSQESIGRVDGNLALLARTYAVDGLLKSTVVVDQEEFTLQLTLIGSNGQDVLWASNEYAGELVQFIEPVRGAASELAAALGDETRTLPQPTSENAEAQLALEEGRWFTDRYNNGRLPEDYALAHSAYERALALDPTLADAAADLAGLVYLQAETGSPPDGAAEEFEGWIDQALRIDPRNGRAWTARSTAMKTFGTSQDFATQLEYARRGVLFAPELAGGHVALGNAIGFGANRLSRPAYERAMSLQPMYVYSRLNLGMSQLLQGEDAGAMTTMNEAIAIGPNMPIGLLYLASALTATGQYAEAEAAVDRVTQVDEGRFAENYTLPARAELAAARGDVVAADELTERLLAMIDAPEAGYWDAVYVAYFMGESFAISRPAVALHLLLRASELGVLLPFDALRDGPRFDPLRSEPEFLNLLATSRQSYDIVVSSLRAAEQRGELPAYLEEPLALEVQRARDEG